MKTGLNPRALATRWSQKWPSGVRTVLGPAGDWLDMMFVDHGFLREFYLNLHQVTPQMWRSAQPSPGAIRMLATHGIKTILNLRGKRECGSYVLEQRACLKHGITMIDIPFDSRSAPSAVRVVRAAEVFRTIEYPVLMHCKSGADRAGIVAALYLHLHDELPVPLAKNQLSLRYGHIKQARTGVLDYFFDAYQADYARTGRPLLQWVQSGDYDPDALTSHFRANATANLLVDKILRRE